jgi:predicted RNA binding protein YcfA (HicA-like mRNA interferase family)
MPKLPQIKPTPLVKFFTSQGFLVARQTGSHARLIHPDGRKITITYTINPLLLALLILFLNRRKWIEIRFLNSLNKS